MGPTNLSVYIGDEARKDRIQERLRQTTIAHFATHGVLNERYPWASYIALAGENGHLSLDEVPRTPIVAELVVLSACETGRGPDFGWGRCLGIPIATLSAGAKNVVGRLAGGRRVDCRFYGRVLQSRWVPSGIRTCCERLNSSCFADKWHHPYYWAPFVLYGGDEHSDDQAEPKNAED